MNVTSSGVLPQVAYQHCGHATTLSPRFVGEHPWLQKFLLLRPCQIIHPCHKAPSTTPGFHSPELLSPALYGIWYQQAGLCSCLRRNDLLCCPVFIISAQSLDIFSHQFEDVHCIPLDEEVFVNFLSRLHSEFDTFEVH